MAEGTEAGMLRADQQIDSQHENLDVEEDKIESKDFFMSAEDRLTLAERKKTVGNELYKDKKYAEATRFYTEAIDLCPNCAAYYSNRAAAYLMLNEYEKALADSRHSTQLDPTFSKGHAREAKSLLLIGEAGAAINKYQYALQLDPDNGTFKQENQQAVALQQLYQAAVDSFGKADHRKVLYCMDRAIEISPGCLRFKVMKAENLAQLKRYQEAQELASDILRNNSTNVDAIFVRGLCLYYQDNPEKAFQHFQSVLRLAPDHQKAKDVYWKAKSLRAKKEEGNSAFKAGQLNEACRLYSEALDIDPLNVSTNSKLYFNRATVYAKLQKHEEALEDCNKAIKLDDSYIKAYLRRAKCYMDLEKYEDAVREYERISKMDRSRENSRLLNEAKLELKKSKRKDYYRLLGVGKEATEDDIKKAYKKRALLHHPDRHSGASEGVRKEEEKKFKEIGEAYGVLSDAKRKARYDAGHDLDDGSNGFGDFDPNIIFQSMFNGGQGGFGGFPGASFGDSFHRAHSGGGYSSPGFSFHFG